MLIVVVFPIVIFIVIVVVIVMLIVVVFPIVVFIIVVLVVAIVNGVVSIVVVVVVVVLVVVIAQYSILLCNRSYGWVAVQAGNLSAVAEPTLHQLVPESAGLLVAILCGIQVAPGPLHLAVIRGQETLRVLHATVGEREEARRLLVPCGVAGGVLVSTDPVPAPRFQAFRPWRYLESRLVAIRATDCASLS